MALFHNPIRLNSINSAPLEDIPLIEGQMLYRQNPSEPTRAELFADLVDKDGKLRRFNLLGSDIPSVPTITVLDPVTAASRSTLLLLSGEESIVFFKQVQFIESESPAGEATRVYSCLLQKTDNNNVSIMAVDAHGQYHTGRSAAFSGWSGWEDSLGSKDSWSDITLDALLAYPQRTPSTLDIIEGHFVENDAPDKSADSRWYVSCYFYADETQIVAESNYYQYTNTFNGTEWSGWIRTDGADKIHYNTEPQVDVSKLDLQAIAIEDMKNVSGSWTDIFSEVEFVESDQPAAGDVAYRVEVKKLAEATAPEIGVFTMEAFYENRRFYSEYFDSTTGWSAWIEEATPSNTVFHFPEALTDVTRDDLVSFIPPEVAVLNDYTYYFDQVAFTTDSAPFSLTNDFLVKLVKNGTEYYLEATSFNNGIRYLSKNNGSWTGWHRDLISFANHDSIIISTETEPSFSGAEKSISIADTSVVADNSINIGFDNTVGENSITVGSSNDNQGISFGSNNTVDATSVAVGSNNTSSNSGVALGDSAESDDNLHVVTNTLDFLVDDEKVVVNESEDFHVNITAPLDILGATKVDENSTLTVDNEASLNIHGDTLVDENSTLTVDNEASLLVEANTTILGETKVDEGSTVNIGDSANSKTSVVNVTANNLLVEGATYIRNDGTTVNIGSNTTPVEVAIFGDATIEEGSSVSIEDGASLTINEALTEVINDDYDIQVVRDSSRGIDVIDNTDSAHPLHFYPFSQKLGELDDVEVSGVTDGESLTYNATDGKWEAKDTSTGHIGGVPVGTIATYTGDSVPSGWLRCNGATFYRVNYSRLYARIKGLYGPYTADSATLPTQVNEDVALGYDLIFTGDSVESVITTGVYLKSDDTKYVQFDTDSDGNYGYFRYGDDNFYKFAADPVIVNLLGLNGNMQEEEFKALDKNTILEHEGVELHRIASDTSSVTYAGYSSIYNDGVLTRLVEKTIRITNTYPYAWTLKTNTLTTPLTTTEAGKVWTSKADGTGEWTEVDKTADMHLVRYNSTDGISDEDFTIIQATPEKCVFFDEDNSVEYFFDSLSTDTVKFSVVHSEGETPITYYWLTLDLTDNTAISFFSAPFYAPTSLGNNGQALVVSEDPVTHLKSLVWSNVQATPDNVTINYSSDDKLQIKPSDSARQFILTDADGLPRYTNYTAIEQDGVLPANPTENLVAYRNAEPSEINKGAVYVIKDDIALHTYERATLPITASGRTWFTVDFNTAAELTTAFSTIDWSTITGVYLQMADGVIIDKATVGGIGTRTWFGDDNFEGYVFLRPNNDNNTVNIYHNTYVQMAVNLRDMAGAIFVTNANANYYLEQDDITKYYVPTPYEELPIVYGGSGFYKYKSSTGWVRLSEYAPDGITITSDEAGNSTIKPSTSGNTVLYTKEDENGNLVVTWDTIPEFFFNWNTHMTTVPEADRYMFETYDNARHTYIFYGGMQFAPFQVSPLGDMLTYSSVSNSPLNNRPTVATIEINKNDWSIKHSERPLYEYDTDYFSTSSGSVVPSGVLPTAVTGTDIKFGKTTDNKWGYSVDGGVTYSPFREPLTAILTKNLSDVVTVGGTKDTDVQEYATIRITDNRHDGLYVMPDTRGEIEVYGDIGNYRGTLTVDTTKVPGAGTVTNEMVRRGESFMSANSSNLQYGTMEEHYGYYGDVQAGGEYLLPEGYYSGNARIEGQTHCRSIKNNSEILNYSFYELYNHATVGKKEISFTVAFGSVDTSDIFILEAVPTSYSGYNTVTVTPATGPLRRLNNASESTYLNGRDYVWFIKPYSGSYTSSVTYTFTFANAVKKVELLRIRGYDSRDIDQVTLTPTTRSSNATGYDTYNFSGHIKVDTTSVPGAGNAPASAVRSAYTFTNSSNATAIQGTMNDSTLDKTSLNCGETANISAGYTPARTVTAKSLSSQTGVESGKSAITASAIRKDYQGWVNGSRITGTMSNVGSLTKTIDPGGSVSFGSGYTTGGTITANSPTFSGGYYPISRNGDFNSSAYGFRYKEGVSVKVGAQVHSTQGMDETYSKTVYVHLGKSGTNDSTNVYSSYKWNYGDTLIVVACFRAGSGSTSGLSVSGYTAAHFQYGSGTYYGHMNSSITYMMDRRMVCTTSYTDSESEHILTFTADNYMYGVFVYVIKGRTTDV